LTTFEDNNRICSFDGSQAVGDDNTRAILHEFVHSTLNQMLGGGVKARRSLIENHQPRVFEEDARKG